MGLQPTIAVYEADPAAPISADRKGRLDRLIYRFSKHALFKALSNDTG